MRKNRCGNYVTNVVTKNKILLLMDIFILLIRGRGARITREGRGKKTSTRGGIVIYFQRLLLPSFRPFNVKRLKIVSTRSKTRCTLRTLYSLYDRNCFKRRVRRLLSLPSNFLCRIGMSFYLTTYHSTVRRTSVLTLRVLWSKIVDTLLILIRQISKSSFFRRYFICTACFLLMSFRCAAIRGAIRCNENNENTLRRFNFKSFFCVSSTRMTKRFRVFRRRIRLLKNATLRLIRRSIRTIFITNNNNRTCANFNLELVNATRFFLCRSNLFIRR